MGNNTEAGVGFEKLLFGVSGTLSMSLELCFTVFLSHSDLEDVACGD